MNLRSRRDHLAPPLADSAGGYRCGYVGILLAGLALVAGAAVGGAAGAEPGDTYLDPLAYTHIDARAPAVNLVIERRATHETVTVSARRLLQGCRELYLSSADLATALQAARYWQDTLRRLEINVGGQAFGVTGGSRVVTGPGSEALLPVPVLDHEGDLWLPLAALLQVMGPAARQDVAYDAEAGRLLLGALDDNVDGIGVEILGRSTVVHIRCRDALEWSVTRPQPDTIEVNLGDGRADVGALGRTAASGLVRGFTARQESGRLLVDLALADAGARHRAYAANGGREIVVVLEEVQVASLPDPVPAGEVNLAIAPAAGADRSERRPLATIVIDPGHGGADTGAIGGRGIMEKDVNLAVARELKQYLEHVGDVTVVLTRSRDESLELDARAEAANVAGGDLFISLHCNSWFSSQARGFETYFLSPASSDWARSVEAAENGAAAAGREPGDVEFIVWELVQNQFITRSSAFAEFLQARVCATLGIPDRGVRQAGFRVLVGAHMPAVLVELGFLSRADEELLLGERGYQRQLAQAIGEAVLAFGRERAGADGPGEGAP